MNENSLSYHTKLQDWSQIYHLKADGQVCKASRVPFLAPHKFDQIDTWRRDVSRKRSQTANIFKKRNQTETVNQRSKSANPQVRLQPLVNHQTNKSTWSSKSTYTSQLELSAVSNNLAETTLHYAAQREEIYRAKGKSIPVNRKLHTGDETEVPIKPAWDEQTQEGEREESIKESSEYSVETDFSDVSMVTMANRGNMIQVKDQAIVAVRSQSNNLLNVISIDDCKLAFRMKQAKLAQKGQGKARIGEQDNNSDEKTTNHVTSQKSSYGGATDISDSVTKGKSRTAKITKAIDGMVHDRKVMNNLDRNFDTRIGPFGRIVLERPEGGPAFRRLNSALKKHINDIMVCQTRRITSNHSGSTNGSDYGANDSDLYTNGNHVNGDVFDENDEHDIPENDKSESDGDNGAKKDSELESVISDCVT